ncbi:putative aminotransferase [Desulfamplus magnetovallimortis]|uniref:Putative aminotransferase n=1 Tax=Desulfamplus magnetovallimortis TaxID=1246637 RepID=A0A1W1HF07_9BACT|nr:LegC family aminotransferase [Desulfamplus magnetovallimortis]SLM30962.1 putative aminotransferase [Desulfamplus magnetovallimortis]
MINSVNNKSNQLIQAIESVISNNTRPVPLHEPSIGKKEVESVSIAAQSGWVSYLSNDVDRFEAVLAEITGIPYVVAMNSGTAALHLALILAGVGPGDEVLMPSLTFVATANAVYHAGAIPHFIDIEQETLGISPDILEAHLLKIAKPNKKIPIINKLTGRRIAAIVPVHIFGHPPKMDELSEITNRYAIPMVEDSAEALGSYFNNKHAGSYGIISTLSFNGNKIVTTGGGGALMTHNRNLAELARHLSSTAKIPHPWKFDHDEVAFNYRMPGINAALGIPQLERVDLLLKQKRNLFQCYHKAFQDISWMKLFTEPRNAKSNFWLNAIILKNDGENIKERYKRNIDEENLSLRDAILEKSIAAGIHMRPAWTPMHKLPMFSHCQKSDLHITESLEKRIICLPSSPKLMEISNG